jgi:hypothetical protein
VPSAMKSGFDPADAREQPDDPKWRVERLSGSSLVGGCRLGDRHRGRSSLDILADDTLEVQLRAHSVGPCGDFPTAWDTQTRSELSTTLYRVSAGSPAKRNCPAACPAAAHGPRGEQANVRNDPQLVLTYVVAVSQRARCDTDLTADADRA